MRNILVRMVLWAGMGAALVPRLTVDEADPGIATVDLGERLPPRLIGIAWHRDRRRTRAAEAFVALSQKLTTGVGASAEAA